MPVAPEDYEYLVSLVTRTRLKMSAITRLLLHRGITLHRQDGHLD